MDDTSNNDNAGSAQETLTPNTGSDVAQTTLASDSTGFSTTVETGDPAMASEDAGVNETTEEPPHAGTVDPSSIPEHCGNCNAWLQNQQQLSLGLCRHNPPQAFRIVNKDGSWHFVSQFPPMMFDGWCAQHKRGELKLLPPPQVPEPPSVPVNVNLGNVTPLGNRRPHKGNKNKR
jgi:hypothetical protein